MFFEKFSNFSILRDNEEISVKLTMGNKNLKIILTFKTTTKLKVTFFHLRNDIEIKMEFKLFVEGN